MKKMTCTFITCVLIAFVLFDLAQAIIGEFLWRVAKLAGLARRSQLFGVQGELIGFEGSGDQVLYITRLAGDARGYEAFADVAVHAVDAGVRGGEVGGIFRRHGMAGLAAEGWGVGVVPDISPGGQYQECQHS